MARETGPERDARVLGMQVDDEILIRRVGVEAVLSIRERPILGGEEARHEASHVIYLLLVDGIGRVVGIIIHPDSHVPGHLDACAPEFGHPVEKIVLFLFHIHPHRETAGPVGFRLGSQA